MNIEILKSYTKLMIREGYMRNDVLDGLLDFGNIKQKDSMYSQAGRPDNGNGLDKGEVRHGGRNLYRGDMGRICLKASKRTDIIDIVFCGI